MPTDPQGERKECIRCSQVKPLSEFYRNTKQREYQAEYRAHCKACHSPDKPSEKKSEALRLIAQGLKKCGLCGQIKPFSEFNRRAAGRGGYSGRCRPCGFLQPSLLAHSQEIIRQEIAGERTCIQCGQVKPLTDYHFSGLTARGLPRRYRRCKACYGPRRRVLKPQSVKPKVPKPKKQTVVKKAPRPLPNTRGRFTPNRYRVEDTIAFIELTDRDGLTIAETKVSVCDLPRILAAGRWHFNKRKRPLPGYISRSFRDPETGKPGAEWLHRFILQPPHGMVCDHINGDGLDNRRENLRIVTPAENLKNTYKTR